MLNVFILEGKIIDQRIMENNELSVILELESNNKFNNIEVYLNGNILNNFCKHCKLGDVISVQGHIESHESLQYKLIVKALTCLTHSY